MAIKDFFHPIFRRALDVEEEQHGLHDTIVKNYFFLIKKYMILQTF